MVTFLAGTITENPNNDAARGFITNQYGLSDELRKNWKPSSRCLYVCSQPQNYGENDGSLCYFRDCFARSGFDFSCFDLADDRYADDFTAERLASYDVIIMGCGRVPTQRAFAERLHLREVLASFDGIVIGISAGALNLAEETYNWPEEPGDTTDFTNPRFYQGLGLVKTQVLPHFQARWDMYVDGRHLYNDITAKDSRGHEFIALPDYSYIVAENGHETICGPYSCYRNGLFLNFFEQESLAG